MGLMSLFSEEKREISSLGKEADKVLKPRTTNASFIG